MSKDVFWTSELSQLADDIREVREISERATGHEAYLASQLAAHLQQVLDAAIDSLVPFKTFMPWWQDWQERHR
jgi:hypothetical protein